MATLQAYRVTFHYANGGKRTIGPMHAQVSVTPVTSGTPGQRDYYSFPSAGSIVTALANNGFVPPSGWTVDIEIIKNADITVLT